MCAKASNIGRKGEEIGKQYLLGQGYEILETNYRYKKAEVDIIARHSNQLIFIEVKARKNIKYGRPEEFVSKRKEAFYFDAANAYMEAVNYRGEIRFDIISIVDPNGSPTLDHFIDAFFPGI